MEEIEHKRRKRLFHILLATVGVSVFLLAILTGYLSLIWYYQRNQKSLISNYTTTLKELTRKDELSDGLASDRLKREKEVLLSIHGLRNYGDAPVDFSHIHLHDLDLTNIDLTNARFVTTILSGINFSSETTKRDLTYLPFDDSVVAYSKFDASDLSFSQFLNAKLLQTSFVNSTLYRAAFDNALLCDVNFTGANLELATFWNSSTDPATIRTLGNTAWWLAKGWNVDQLHALSRQAPVELTQSPAFRAKREEAEKAVTSAPPDDNLGAALALNNLAWELAISKVDLMPKSAIRNTSDQVCRPNYSVPSNARDAADTALCIVNKLAGAEKENIYLTSTTTPSFQDTLGYILLEENDADDALKYLNEASQKATETNRGGALDQGGTLDRGGILFRLSVAKNASGAHDAIADMRKSIVELGYVPTHEFATLSSLLDKNQFRDELEAALRERYPQHGMPQPCPNQPPASIRK